MASGMLARRSASTTSLAKYYHEMPDPDQSSQDFCNAFWGPNDVGVEVLFARMRGACRTMEELRGYWKERIAIEEDYAKRLVKLAKVPLGRDEIGDLRAALDTLRVETDKQAQSHLLFGQNMRRELEQPSADFIGKQNNHKKTFQANIEKSYKAKQTQEKYVEKARERYESDCVLINSCTAQSTLLQGKELDKIQMKLERAQQTLRANERDYQNFARALADTCKRWEGEWKTYCDQSQDLEDERIEFMKDNIWAYANGISTVCVADDESCEKIRLTLEQVEAEKDMDNFVREYGTGPIISEPTPFISYKSSSPPSRPRTKTANFLRSSIRAPLMRPDPPQPYADEYVQDPGNAGIGAVGRDGRDSRAGPPPPANGSMAPSSSMSAVSSQQTGTSMASNQSAASGRTEQTQRDQGRRAEPQTILAIGGNAYPVDPTADPQSARNFAGPVGGENDPLAQALSALKAGGSVNRNGAGSSVRNSIGASAASGAGRVPSTPTVPPKAQEPAPRNNQSVDYRNVANDVIGAAPPSRGSSPQPYAAHMQGPTQTPQQLSNLHQQSFPGERRLSISRQNSAQPPRSPSPARDGFAGIGTRGQSPGPPAGYSQGGPGSRTTSPQQQGRGPAAYQSPSPAPLGIALDPSGRVAHDSMAEEYARRDAQHQQHQNYGGPAPRGQAPGYNQPQQGYGNQPQGGQRPPSVNGYSAAAGPVPYSGGYPAQPTSSQPAYNERPSYDQQPSYSQPQAGMRLASPPAARPASPAVNPTAGSSAAPTPPTGQFLDDGSGVLFYVKALYDYNASIPEEFDFQAGDVIAVTATPDDGWWSGVLLDDSRRVPGRTTFPSNFVCLF